MICEKTGTDALTKSSVVRRTVKVGRNLIVANLRIPVIGKCVREKMKSTILSTIYSIHSTQNK